MCINVFINGDQLITLNSDYFKLSVCWTIFIKIKKLKKDIETKLTIHSITAT